MRGSRVFLLGAIVGGAVVWLWGREMEAYVEERTRGVRTTVAEGVRAVEETAGQVLDRGGEALRRAEDFLEDTKAHVSEALQAGQEAIRPAPANEGTMRPMTLVGVALIILGVLALAYQGITYTDAGEGHRPGAAPGLGRQEKEHSAPPDRRRAGAGRRRGDGLHRISKVLGVTVPREERT